MAEQQQQQEDFIFTARHKQAVIPNAFIGNAPFGEVEIPKVKKGKRPVNTKGIYLAVHSSNKFGVVLCANNNELAVYSGETLTDKNIIKFDSVITCLAVSSFDQTLVAIGFKEVNEKEGPQLKIFSLATLVYQQETYIPLKQKQSPSQFHSLKWSRGEKNNIIIRNSDTKQTSLFVFEENDFEDLSDKANCASFDLKGNIIVVDNEQIVNFENGNPIGRVETSIHTVFGKEHKQVFMLEEYAPDKWIAVSLKVQKKDDVDDDADAEDDDNQQEDVVIDILTGGIDNLELCIPMNESQEIALEGSQENLCNNKNILEFKLIPLHENNFLIAQSIIEIQTIVKIANDGKEFTIVSDETFKVKDVKHNLLGIAAVEFEAAEQDATVEYKVNADVSKFQKIPKSLITYDLECKILRHFVCYDLSRANKPGQTFQEIPEGRKPIKPQEIQKPEKVQSVQPSTAQNEEKTKEELREQQPQESQQEKTIDDTAQAGKTEDEQKQTLFQNSDSQNNSKDTSSNNGNNPTDLFQSNSKQSDLFSNPTGSSLFPPFGQVPQQNLNSNQNHSGSSLFPPFGQGPQQNLSLNQNQQANPGQNSKPNNSFNRFFSEQKGSLGQTPNQLVAGSSSIQDNPLASSNLSNLNSNNNSNLLQKPADIGGSANLFNPAIKPEVQDETQQINQIAPSDTKQIQPQNLQEQVIIDSSQQENLQLRQQNPPSSASSSSEFFQYDAESLEVYKNNLHSYLTQATLPQFSPQKTIFNHNQQDHKNFSKKIKYSTFDDITFNLSSLFTQASIDATQYVFERDIFLFSANNLTDKVFSSSSIYALTLDDYSKMHEKIITKLQQEMETSNQAINKMKLKKENTKKITAQALNEVKAFLESKEVFKSDKKILQIEIIFAGAFVAVVLEDQIRILEMSSLFRDKDISKEENDRKEEEHVHFDFKIKRVIFSSTKKREIVLAEDKAAFIVVDTFSQKKLFTGEASFACFSSSSDNVIYSIKDKEIIQTNLDSGKEEVRFQLEQLLSAERSLIHLEELNDGLFFFAFLVTKEENTSIKVFIGKDLKNLQEVTCEKSFWGYTPDLKVSTLQIKVVYSKQLRMLVAIMNQKGTFFVVNFDENNQPIPDQQLDLPNWKNRAEISGFVFFPFKLEGEENYFEFMDGLGTKIQLTYQFPSLIAFSGLFSLDRFIEMDLGSVSSFDAEAEGKQSKQKKKYAEFNQNISREEFTQIIHGEGNNLIDSQQVDESQQDPVVDAVPRSNYAILTQKLAEIENHLKYIEENKLNDQQIEDQGEPIVEEEQEKDQIPLQVKQARDKLAQFDRKREAKLKEFSEKRIDPSKLQVINPDTKEAEFKELNKQINLKILQTQEYTKTVLDSNPQPLTISEKISPNNNIAVSSISLSNSLSSQLFLKKINVTLLVHSNQLVSSSGEVIQFIGLQQEINLKDFIIAGLIELPRLSSASSDKSNSEDCIIVLEARNNSDLNSDKSPLGTNSQTTISKRNYLLQIKISKSTYPKLELSATQVLNICHYKGSLVNISMTKTTLHQLLMTTSKNKVKLYYFSEQKSLKKQTWKDSTFACFYDTSKIMIGSTQDIKILILEMNDKEQLILNTLKQKSFVQLGISKDLLRVASIQRISDNLMILVALLKESNAEKLSFQAYVLFPGTLTVQEQTKQFNNKTTLTAPPPVQTEQISFNLSTVQFKAFMCKALKHVFLACNQWNYLMVYSLGVNNWTFKLSEQQMQLSRVPELIGMDLRSDTQGQAVFTEFNQQAQITLEYTVVKSTKGIYAMIN